MTNCWIFQANPDHYDIDAALPALDTIHWRTPQYTYQIAPGDDALIWRSGEEAGVVGVAKVMGPPGQRPAPSEERRFYADEDAAVQDATRVPLRVESVDLLSKGEFARIDVLENHQIVTAPMGTVFPLEDEAWSALLRARSELGKLSDLEVDAGERTIPEVFAWEDRGKSVYPLPGGFGNYFETLRAILTRVRDRRPGRSDLEAWIRQEYDVSEHSSRMSLLFLERTSLLSVGTDQVELTDHGEYWLQSGDATYLVGLLHSRMQLMGELMKLLEEHGSPDRLLEEADRRYGMGWNTRAQVDRRRGWLQSAGMLEVGEEADWHLTAEGRLLLEDLELAPPRPPAEETGRTEGEVEKEEEGLGSAVGPSAGEAVADLLARSEELATGLRDRSTESKDPDAFERIVAEAFSFLGFEASWLGGSGQTDVLLVAELGPDSGYRVVVDCKTTGRDRVSEAQIGWIALEDHRERHGADYTALVGPAFAGAKLPEHAAQQDVALIDVDALVSIVKQHAVVPMGLDVYRDLFVAGGVSEPAAKIGEAAEEAERRIRLAALAATVIRREEGEEGALTSQDLYWLLKEHAEDLGDPQKDEIEETLRALSHPGVGVLRRVDGGYGTPGSLRISAARLRKLAALLEVSEAEDQPSTASESDA